LRHDHYAFDWHIAERFRKGCCVSIILGSRSLSRLKGVHPDLVRVVKKAAAMSNLDFTVLEGLRTLDRQRKLLAQGASKTLNSRHITGHAVDLAPLIDGKVSWDWPLYHRLAKIVKAAAADENVPIVWGGDWRTFKDGPHWELPWKIYPKGK
jgi:peptidoglycan LD-endopeptidase CwlK